MCLIAAAALTAAAIWRRCRPKVVVSRCRRIVEEAEVCSNMHPERTQHEFRRVIESLRPVHCALAQRCPWHSDNDRIFFHLMMPATARLRDDAQDILGRAEHGIGLSLRSQQTATQKAASAISGIWARRLAWSCAVAREREQFLTNLQDEAICHLEAAVALAPKRGDYLYALARAYELAGKNEDSLAVIQAAIALNPAVDEYYGVLASVAWKTGAYDLYNRGLLGIVESSGLGSRGRSSRTI
jgi:tetratricopeptide (TPR) repeat protein